MKEKYIRMIKMEAAISCSACHPNVVTTYRYSIHRGAKSSRAKSKQKASTQGSSAVDKSDCLPSHDEGGAVGQTRQVQVLEVRLLQECCNLGTLRAAIKQKKLAKGHNVFSPPEEVGLGADTPPVAVDSRSRCGVQDQTDTAEGQLSQGSICDLEGMMTVETYRKMLVGGMGDENPSRVSMDSSNGMGLSDNMQVSPHLAPWELH
jgi:hypothetical protein